MVSLVIAGFELKMGQPFLHVFWHLGHDSERHPQVSRSSFLDVQLLSTFAVAGRSLRQEAYNNRRCLQDSSSRRVRAALDEAADGHAHFGRPCFVGYRSKGTASNLL